MRIIATSRLRAWCKQYPDAASALRAWAHVSKDAAWQNLMEVRESFPTADGVQVASGRTVTVFNIRRNRYRLLVAIHYRGSRVYLLRFLTHEDYADVDWKDRL